MTFFLWRKARSIVPRIIQNSTCLVGSFSQKQASSQASTSTSTSTSGTAPAVVLLSSAAAAAAAAHWLGYLPAKSNPKQKQQAQPTLLTRNYPLIAKEFSRLCQEYLIIVSDGEKLDSLQRIEQLAGMDTARRKQLLEQEFQVIAAAAAAAAASGEPPSNMSRRSRNQKLLQQHLQVQEQLVQLVTCSFTDASQVETVCSKIMKRRLNDLQLEEIRQFTLAELQQLKEKAARLLERDH